MAEKNIEKLKNALGNSKFTVAITGAGISLAAGGVTYSGMGGRLGGRDMLSGDPQRMYDAYYKVFLSSMFEHGPTYAHKALATLEQQDLMHGIITTNVDCMHTMGGSEKVAEIQGSFQKNVCTGCGKWTYGYDIWKHGKMPICENCGEMILPFNMYSHAGLLESELKKAQEWMSRADFIIIIGANGSYTHTYWNYKKRDASIIQINPSRTYFDSVADINIKDGADPVFKALMEMC